MKKHYTAEYNHCRCHPETCSCDPYKVVIQGEKTIITVWSRERAEWIAKRLNIAEKHKPELKEKNEAK